MATGKVRFFNDSKGFGLITPDIAGPALFAHGWAIVTPGLKKLKVSQLVEFDIDNRPEGLTALNIRALT